ncbi:calcineurin-like phosphoesterase [Hirsutella rhossiliensis]|uniref:Calcineurin-like phosphoesterase domain-containing protein n=1 Tax=Hirsutella rhossiliensis TaxID=111463 RepID=A0A9P8N2S4_9HYPO|nr:calcineurin-like phosphoesterase domain-containing protein [Hirsutella rhossiliensis]KAH0963657.1 calcineurin-like phosphoesterase domain-containing protein [Hirsutella rhossiliensis]
MAATAPTRIVCIADTHNCTVKLPKGHVLIHAGDLTNQGSYSELSKAIKWLEAADFEAKIVVAGNHDITLDSAFYAEHGLRFHNKDLQSPAACLSLLTSSPSITYLDHDSATIRLKSPAGPRTEFTIFGSPYSPCSGLWAFSYGDAAGLPQLWDSIPQETDIVVTHTPPRTHCDRTATDGGRAAGCEALRRALWRVRPRLAICGHVHDGRGAERVTWDTDADAGCDFAFPEKSTYGWTDGGAGNNKLSLVDLTGRHSPALANDGFVSCRHVEAQTGMSGRRETCVVNAAIMKSRYPHVGGKQLNKPIVVNVNLPVCQTEESSHAEA